MTTNDEVAGGETPHVLGASTGGTPPQPAKLGVGRNAPAQVALFAAMIALGAIIMASPLPVEAHFASALFLTAVYCIVGWLFQWHRRPGSGEQFIDSCYYLGFIFTQIALAISFWKAFQSGGQFSANDLVPLVATALGASVIGLIAKVVLDQTVEDLTVLPEQVQRDLTTSATAIARDTQGVAQTFGELSQVMNQAAADIRLALSGAGGMTGLAQSHQQSLRETLGELGDAVHSLKAQMAQSGQSAQKGVSDMVGDLRATMDVIAELRVISSQIGALGETAQRVLAESSSAFAAANQAGRAFEERMNENLDAIREDFAGIADRVEANANTIVETGMRDAQADLASRLQALSAELRRAEESMTGLVTTFDRNLRELSDMPSVRGR